MRSILILAACMLVTPLSAMSDSPVADDVYVIFDADLPMIEMSDGDITYSAKEVNWPTARVRVLMFDDDSGGVSHPITDETLLYVLSGAATVGVDGETVSIVAGDVVSFPSGELGNPGAPADATIVTWTAPSLTGEMPPTLVKGADVAEGGGGAIKLKRYEFPGNSVRAVKLAGGSSTNPNSAKTDSLIYVTGGPMTFHQNGQEFVVNTGDFIREIAGLQHHWTITSDSGFVTTSGKPLDMDQINPDEATDRPPER